LLCREQLLLRLWTVEGRNSSERTRGKDKDKRNVRRLSISMLAAADGPFLWPFRNEPSFLLFQSALLHVGELMRLMGLWMCD
jgi:hypothetical protein